MNDTPSLLVQHTLSPVYTPSSRVLILGTMPSPASRTIGCYYGHPQNRFWKVMTALFPEDPPASEPSLREEWLKRHHIAMWDVLASCRITGASDSTITEPVPNPISFILDQAPIRAIFTTGSKAYELYNKHCLPMTGRPAILLPSPSPANCRRHTVETLTKAYRVMVPYL